MASTLPEPARGALANKLRTVRAEEAQTPPAPTPPAPGPSNPFEGAVEPVVVQHPVFADALPRKRIVSPDDLELFRQSPAFRELLGMIEICNTGVRNRKLTDPIDEAERIETLVHETPRDTDSASTSRFGNPAFRVLYDKIVQATDALLQILPGLEGSEPIRVRARQELAVYFYESWGNAKRIDYGSGMELNFLCWLLLLVKLGVLQLPRDAPAIVLRVFWRYIEIMRTIQSTYWLEPAGSHGVWGLDDYHFLPFLWGAAQLRDHTFLRPKSIHDRDIVDECAKHYMYFACIEAINAIKTESLRWHSPMLDDISCVRTWAKVNEGMTKMYRAEVLLKLPIAQHIFFGTLIDFGVSDTASTHVEEDEHGHRFELGKPHGHGAHGHGEGQAAGWGDCCGIPIPSAFAAAERAQGATGRPAVRRIPFD